MDVEDVRGTLAPYHALLREQLEHYGGTVEKFIGDAVMALFGAPVAHEDDPERAVRAALSIRAAIDRLNDAGAGPRPARPRRREHRRGAGRARRRRRPRRGRGVRRRGQHGRAPAVGRTGRRHPGRRDHLPRHRPRDHLPAAPSRSWPRASPSRCRVWEAVEARARLGVDVVQRPTTPLVGRGEEVDLLLDALRRCRSERAVQLVTLVGVPGIGKSRLVWELMRGGRARSRLHHLAPGALAAVRRRRHLLGARRDGEGAGGHPRLRHRPARRRTSCSATVADLIHDPAEAAWVEEHVRALAGLEARPAPAETATARRPPPGAGSWRRSPTATRWCWCSRTCTGPTTRCSTSSTISPTGRATCRCWSSAPPGRSCSTAAAAGAAASETRSRWRCRRWPTPTSRG